MGIEAPARSNNLFVALCDPALTREEATALARAALKKDSLADVKLAKRLAQDASRLAASTARRLMEVLDEVSTGSGIMPSLLQLLRLADPELRSKAELMIGRANRSVDWAKNCLGDIDPRARANAVEALWGNDTTYVRDLLRSAARDSNNRVAGNALYALYGLGETWTIPELLKMASSEVPRRRASAAWAMGETGDMRFADAIGFLTCDLNASVRKRASAALDRVRNADAKKRMRPEWSVAARILPSLDGARRISVDVNHRPAPRLIATDFVLREDRRWVNDYQVEERCGLQPLGVTFVFPVTGDSDTPPWVEGALNCIRLRRRSDVWRTVYFGETDDAGESAPALPPFISGAEAADGLRRQAAPAERRAFWSSVRHCVGESTLLPPSTSAPTKGPPRLLVYCRADPGIPEDASEIISTAQSAKAMVQVIAGVPNPALEDLCRRTHGSLWIAVPENDLKRQVEEAYQALLARFLITYAAIEPNADSVQICVSNSEGWSETTVTLER